MGKIYKNPTPSQRNIIQTVQFFEPPKPKQNFILPQATVIPADQFDIILKNAINALETDNLEQALQDLLNLEVTDFNNIHVHELLADVFLKLNQLTLAKEQCQICARLISQIQGDDNIFTLKSFEELVQDAGNFNEINEEYKEIMKNNITEENYHHGTKIALNLATLHISENRYKEAEKILVAYRNRYIQALKTAN